MERVNAYRLELGEDMDPGEHIELFGDTFTSAVHEAGNDKRRGRPLLIGGRPRLWVVG